MFDIKKLQEQYEGKELLDKILEKIHEAKAGGDLESAQEGSMTGMAICMWQVSEREDNLYYKRFLDYYDEYITAIDSDNKSKDIIEFSFSAVRQVENFIKSAPENYSLKSMIMDMLDKGAAYGENNMMLEVTMELYECQRDILIKHFEKYDINSIMADIDAKLIPLYMLCGKSDLAKELGDESYNIMERLYKEDPVNYSSFFIDLCSNYGGLFMEDNDFDKAEKIFSQGLEAWDYIPENEKGKYISEKITIDFNLEKIKNLRRKAKLK